MLTVCVCIQYPGTEIVLFKSSFAALVGYIGTSRLRRPHPLEMDRQVLSMWQPERKCVLSTTVLLQNDLKAVFALEFCCMSFVL